VGNPADHYIRALSVRKLIPILVAAIVHAVLSAEPAYAWGLGTHVQLAYGLLSQLSLLPAAAAALLSKYGLDYLYGNIAADYVVAKRLSHVKQFCHQWATGFRIFDSTSSEPGRAFALGYLSHLAADTVAHNKYVPHQLTVTRTTMEFGHAYWELRADLLVRTPHWHRLRRLLAHRFWDHEALLEQRLDAALLPFRVNREVFRKFNLFISHDAARSALAVWERWSRFPLGRDMLDGYLSECIDRTVDVIAYGPKSALMREDPNGSLALATTRQHRRFVRHLARSGVVTREFVNEAATMRQPAPWPLTELIVGNVQPATIAHWTDRENGSANPARELLLAVQ
jgi:hypothetical protein